MCRAFDIQPSFGYHRITRTEIRYAKLYAYAAIRYVDALTPVSTYFWRRIMNACTIQISHWEMTERRREDYRRYGC